MRGVRVTENSTVMSGAVLAMLSAATTAAIVVGCALEFPHGAPAPPPGPADLAQLWVEPRDLEQRDLRDGVGGAALAPDPAATFRFRSEKKNVFASSPGLKVADARGQRWNVKLGPEARAEVLASRIIWAVGYHQSPVYHLAQWTLERDGEHTAQGSSRFRPILPRLKRHGHWSWQDNPFVETQAFRGLIVLMAVLNNWDLTTSNTAIYEVDGAWEGARRWYVVRDVGASFSHNRGPLLQGTRDDVAGFATQGFIRGVEDGRVQFDWNGPHGDLFDHISAADVRWTCTLLGRLSRAQWHAAFEAAGYGDEEAARLQAALDRRIAAGKALQ
jgi:hypothetical protein